MHLLLLKMNEGGYGSSEMCLFCHQSICAQQRPSEVQVVRKLMVRAEVPYSG